MTNIIPAVMPQNYKDLVEKIEKIPKTLKKVQIDVMDGRFVKSRSWPYNKDERGHFEKILMQEEGFPYWEDFDFSIDLMVADPKEEVERWILAGANEVIIHIESLKQDGLEYIKNLKEEGVIGIGMAIAPYTPIEELDKYIPYIDLVQFMGIENVGYQGEPFATRVLGKIKDFREKYTDMEVSIDGGVGFDTAKDLVESGVDTLVSGSVLFNAVNMKETIERLKDLN